MITWEFLPGAHRFNPKSPSRGRMPASCQAECLVSHTHELKSIFPNGGVLRQNSFKKPPQKGFLQGFIRAKCNCLLNESIHSTSATGMRCAGTASWGTLRHRTAIGMCKEEGQHARSILSLAVLASDRGVSIFNRSQGIKLSPTIKANIFIKWHKFPHSLQRYRNCLYDPSIA